ncbi:MAG: LutC/YkgG family protein [Phototrophicaceae bacterium]
MSNSKANILARLRQHPAPFAHLPAPQTRRVMHPLDDSTNLVELFCAQAQKLSAQVSLPESPAQAIELILQLIGEDRSVLAWDFQHIPLNGLEDALQQARIERAPDRSDGVRVGISGVDAALASTGSIVVSSREGRSRAVSLLPTLHIAVLTVGQILPHLDAWLANQQADLASFRAVGNHIVITGASRTADIGMELVLGAHGPAQLHLVILP